jgi:hypothetical protein
MFYGDSVIPLLWLPTNRKFAKMPTALLRFYEAVPGFLIAADSLSRDRERGISNTENQKLFLINEPSRKLVYAIMGAARINDPTDSFVELDLIKESKNVVDALAKQNAEDLLVYGKKFARRLCTALENAKNSKKIKEYPPFPDPEHPDRCLILTIYLWGYYNGQPSRADVKITHRNQSLNLLDVSGISVTPFPDIIGSQKVAAALFSSSPDSRVVSYHIAAMAKPLETLTLAEGKDVAINYIRACDSPAGHEIDPDLAPGIGGKVQIATIAPTGAQWLDGYEPPVKK